MIVAMQEKATEEQIDAVTDAMVESGVCVHRTTGVTQTILAGVGPTVNLDMEKFEALPGVLYVHRTTGATQTILAGVGPTASIDLAKFELFAGVLYVHRITAPYKLAGRAFRPEGTVVEFPNGATIGGQQAAIIAGPCAIENRDQIFTIAKCVA